jgi:hypothetical protein
MSRLYLLVRNRPVGKLHVRVDQLQLICVRFVVGRGVARREAPEDAPVPA